MTAAEETAKASNTFLAMVAVGEPKEVTAAGLADFMNKTWPSAGPFEPASDTSSAEVISVTGPGDVTLFALNIGLPIPNEDWQLPCETSLGWDGACDEMAKMKGHYIISSMSPEADSESAQLFLASAFAQAVAAQTNALGIYVGGAYSVWSPAQWEENVLLSSPEEPPYMLWFGLKWLSGSEGAYTIVTMGLPAFGKMNIELESRGSDGRDAAGVVADFARYLVTSDVTVADGDTIGSSEDQRIKVTYGPSIVDPKATVYRLNY